MTAATIAPPAGTNYEQPQVAIGDGVSGVVFGSPDHVWFAASHDGGKTFGAPVQVAAVPGLMLGMHRGPRIAITKKEIVITAISNQTKGGSGNLVAWRSGDGGGTWSKEAQVNDLAAAAREGLHAMAAGPDGKLYAIWLDDRSKGKELALSMSVDGGATWSKNQIVYSSPEGTICECCHPSIVVNDEGMVFAMFRNWLKGSRDMYLATSRDGGKTFQTQKLGNETWKLNGCPMDGGGLAVSGRTVNVVYRRGNTIYVDEPGEPEVELGIGKNPATAGSVVLWSTAAGLMGQTSPGKPALVDAKGAYPVAAERGGRVLVAWQSDGRIVVKDKLP